jgi:hypothetical protein
MYIVLRQTTSDLHRVNATAGTLPYHCHGSAMAPPFHYCHGRAMALPGRTGPPGPRNLARALAAPLAGRVGPAWAHIHGYVYIYIYIYIYISICIHIHIYEYMYLSIQLGGMRP